MLDLLDHEPDLLAEAVPRLRRTTDRLRGVVDGVVRKLSTASAALRAEHLPVRGEVDLAGLVARTRADLASCADGRGVALDVRLLGEPRVPCDAGTVAVAVHEVVESALAYAPDGGHVEVVVRDGSDHASLTVVDDGDPPATDLTTADLRSRGRGRLPDERAGLGLAVAAEAMSLLGGTLDLAPSPGGGCVSTLVFPLHRATRS